MHGTLRSGKSMSVLVQSRAEPGVLGHHSESSSSHSISSTPSSQNWYRRALDRFRSPPGSSRQPSLLQSSSTSIKELSRRTSHTLLNTAFNYRNVSSTQVEIGQRNESLVQLPGTPGGQSCRPLSYIVHEGTLSSLDLLTPDQSGISSDSGGPVTPHATESVYSVPNLPASSRGSIMGSLESKFADAKASKIVRKPVSGLLRRKKSQQQEAYDDTSAPPPTSEPRAGPQSTTPWPSIIAEPAPVPTQDHATTQPTELRKSTSNPTGPPPSLRHRASSGQLKVPRRRSSLTAIHLDSSHFEKPLNSKNPEDGSRGIRATSFSHSFQPAVDSSGSSTAVASPLPQGDDKSLGPRSPDSLSFPLSKRPSDAGSALSQSRPLNIRFPETWPDGDPILEPAPLTHMHYQCSRAHKVVMKERALFNQVPCMTCTIDDKEARFTCQWCELRLCQTCMRQLSSNRGRPLAALVRWVADNNVKASHTRDVNTSLTKGKNKETLKQTRSTEAVPKLEKRRTRTDSSAQSVETVKERTSPDRPELPGDSVNVAAITDHKADKSKESSLEEVKGEQPGTGRD